MSDARAPLVTLALALVLIGAAVGWFMVTRPEPRAALLMTGQRVPAFELARLDGGDLALDELRGKVVYVNFWATWCAPCEEEVPALQRLYESLRDEGFEIVAPTIDAPGDEQKIRDFAAEFGMSYPIVLDPERKTYQEYGATGVPETYLLDTSGRLVEAYIGPRDFDDPRYARAIRELLTQRGGGDGGESEAGLRDPVGGRPVRTETEIEGANAAEAALATTAGS